MISLLRAALAAALLASPTVAGAQTAQPAPAQGDAAQNVTRQQVGDWTVICAAAGRPCVMEQVGKTEQGESALSMQIEKLPQPQTVEGRRIEAVGNFLVPLGVLLQAGLKLRVDAGETASSAYFLCQQSGCIVRAPLQPDLLDSLRRGARATLSFTVLNEGQPREVPVAISLSGFTRAYNALP